MIIQSTRPRKHGKAQNSRTKMYFSIGTLKGVLPDNRFLAGYYGFNKKNHVSSGQESFRSSHIMIYVVGCFINYFGEFWVDLEIESFSQRITE